MTIDMKDYAGEQTVSAAEGQQIGTNSYQEESQQDEVHVYKELLPDQAPQPEAPIAAEEPSKQELNFRALREEVDRIKAERDEFRQNLDLLKAQAREQYQARPPEEPKKFLDGLADNDVPNVAEIRKEFERREAMFQMKLEEIEIQQRHPDYAEVIEKFTAPLLKQKPHLAEGIYGARNKSLYAYELGKMAQGQQQQIQAPPPQQSLNAQRIVENASKPGNVARTGGSSALSQAEYYATMSDQDFMRIASKNLGEI